MLRKVLLPAGVLVATIVAELIAAVMLVSPDFAVGREIDINKPPH